MKDLKDLKETWISVREKTPEENKTVWMHNVDTKFIALGCYVWVGDGWLWANSNGVIYEENGIIVSECETDDDYEITHWAELPTLPTF